MTLTDYAVISPVSSWNAREELELPGKVRIGKIPDSVRPRFDYWNHALSGGQIEALSKTEFWFRYDFQDEPIRITEVQRRAMELVRNATLAYQVVRPVGTHETGLFVILCEKNPQGLIIDSVEHYAALLTTRWGRRFIVKPVDFDTLSVVVGGVQETVTKGTIRLENPLYLLELGEQATNLHIRVLLWVAALDTLVMASGNCKKFERRLYNLLGRETRVFPPVQQIIQPKYTVGDIARDLYELRNVIAHGNEIPSKFRKEVGFQDVKCNLIAGYESSYQYRNVLEEAALFLLTSAVRTVFTNNLTAMVRSANSWRALLDRRE